MIDTVNIRLHGIKDRFNNDGLFNHHYDIAYYLRQQTIFSFDSYSKIVNLEFWKTLPNELHCDYFKYQEPKSLEIDFLTYGDTGNTIQKPYRNKIHVDSSHYLCTYSIDSGRDFIEFNFSVPKYLYGNNIAQFVEHYTENNFMPFQNNKFSYNRDRIYERFISFLKKFLFKSCGGFNVDYKRVEICRIDFCLNQFFNSKEEAFEYLEYQKRIDKKQHKTESNILKGGAFNTGISFVTKNWSFKIYHKGSEYKGQKGDKKKHVKLNQTLKKQFFDVDLFQNIADNCLRYEITFRPARISEIFRRNHFRSKDKPYRIQFKRYKKIHSKTRSGKQFTIPLDKNGNRTTSDKAVRFKAILNKEDKKFYQQFKSHLQKHNRFFVEVDKQTKEHYINDNCKDYRYYEIAPFTKELMTTLLLEFRKISKHFEIKQKDTVSSWEERINVYNKSIDDKKKFIKNANNEYLHDAFLNESEKKVKKKHKINPNRLKLLLNMLQHQTLDEVKRSKIFDDRTFYRYKADLKALGIDGKTISDIAVNIDAPLNFEVYHGLTMKYSSILNENLYFN